MKKNNIIVAIGMALSLLHLMSCEQRGSNASFANNDTIVVHDTLIVHEQQCPEGVFTYNLPCKIEYINQDQPGNAYSGDSRSPIPMISVHSVGELLYRRQS
jgi:hypothetical protein